MPKMLLIIPPCFTNPELDFEIGFPVNLLLLGQVVRSEGWDVEYLDMTLEEKEGYDSFVELSGKLEDGSIELVGISNHTVRTSVTTRSVAERIKVRRPDVKLVVGGVNATFMWRELLERCPAIDYVLRGYAQPGLRGLLRSLRESREVTAPGLVKRHSGEFYNEPLAPVSPSDFAVPRLDDLDVARYLEWTQTYSLLTHTGCGFSCNFCTSVMPGPYQNREVYRPIEDVVAEMSQANKRGFDRFFVSDNIFTSRRDYCLELCSALQASGVSDSSTWVCMTRVEFVDEELLFAMKESGCTNIAFGVETASDSQWKSLKKGRFSENTVKNAFSLSRKIGIGTTAYLLLGDPYQTSQDIEATIQLIRELDPDYRVISFFQPFPGTPYWETPNNFGLSEIAPLAEWNFHETPICRTRHLGKQELFNAATRLYFEREGEPRFCPEEDTLIPVTELKSFYPDAPLPVQDAFLSLKKSPTVGELLEQVAAEHGTRGRLMTLYWLSSAVRDGFARIAKQDKSAVHPCGQTFMQGNRQSQGALL